MAQGEMKDKSGMKDGEVRPKDNVTVYGTEKSPMGTGKPYTVHKSAAEKLVANGMATWEDPKAPKDSKTTKSER